MASKKTGKSDKRLHRGKKLEARKPLKVPQSDIPINKPIDKPTPILN